MAKRKTMQKQTSVFKQYQGQLVFGLPAPTKRGDIAKLKVLLFDEVESILVERSKKDWKTYVQSLP